MAAFRILRGSMAYSAKLEQSKLASLRTLMMHSTYTIPVYGERPVGTVGITQCTLYSEFVKISLLDLYSCNSSGIRFKYFYKIFKMGAIDIKSISGRTVALAIIQLKLFVSNFVATACFNILATAQVAPAPASVISSNSLDDVAEAPFDNWRFT